MTNRQVLLMIAAFVTITLGSFIWYVATWDADKRTSASPTDAPFITLAEIFQPAVPATKTGTIL